MILKIHKIFWVVFNLAMNGGRLGRASRRRLGTTVGVAPTSSTGSGDDVANSGDGGGGSNDEESGREMGASSGRERELHGSVL